ncbi:MAG: outer membrane protein [Rhodoblastus sp.]|jgi:outer membrane immunogenic protein
MKMIKIFAAALAVSTIAGSAFAADLPSRKVAPAYVAPAPVFMWTGFYIGLNGGYAFAGNGAGNGGRLVSTDDFHGTFPGGPAWVLGTGPSGGIFGGQIGYNFQLSPSFVAGIETDIQGAWLRGSTQSVATVDPVGAAALGQASFSQRVDWYGTLRARLGFLATPSWLLYATGGLAYGGVKSSLTYFDINHQGHPGLLAGGIGSNSQTRVGYTVGAGAEWMFAPNWTVKAEYGYVDLGRSTANMASTFNTLPVAGAAETVTLVAATHSYRTSFHTLRAGVNYKFGWGAAPVVAKY